MVKEYEGRLSNRFVPGVSGNPNGRPKIYGALREACQGSLLETFNIIMDLVRNATTPPAVRVKGIEMLWGYGFGKPAQTISIENPSAGLELKDITSTQLLNEILQLEAQKDEVAVAEEEKKVEGEIVPVESNESKPKRRKLDGKTKEDSSKK